MTISPEQAPLSEAFGKWLNEFKATSPSQHHAVIGSTRKMIVRSVLSAYKVDRLADLPLQTQTRLATALRIRVKDPLGPHKPVAYWMNKTDSRKPSRPYTPGPRQAVAERPTITDEGLVKFEFPGHAASNGMIDPDFTAASDRLNAKREEMKQARLDRYAEELRADARGDLFTIVAAYNPDNVFLIIFQGFMDDEWHEAFLSQHTEAHMHLDRTTAIADKGGFSAMRAEVVRRHTGTYKGDVTVRVILKKTEAT